LDLKSLTQFLPSICSKIFNLVGSQQLEATYQRCLKVDLEEAGLDVLIEPTIELTYKGHVVGSRRPDLIVKTGSGARAILELKAVDKPTTEHMKQLEFYLHRTSIDRGYLINFPHDSGVESVDNESIFSINVLHGLMEKLSLVLTGGPTLRLRNGPDKRLVEVIEVHRRDITPQDREKKQAEEKAEQLKPEGVFGVNKDGEYCKICIKQQRFCHKHLDQQNMK
jgi:GxxExxY protein